MLPDAVFIVSSAPSMVTYREQGSQKSGNGPFDDRILVKILLDLSKPSRYKVARSETSTQVSSL